jgi:hypothetical protein
VRGAWPLVVPAVPTRFPADAVAPVTRRHEETPACPGGNRVIAWMASRHTRRRIVPRPGTVGSRSSGLASWGVGGCEAGEFAIATQRSVIADARASHCDTLVHSRISTALGAPSTVGFGGHRLADRRPRILAVGIVDVGQELGPVACQRHPAPEQGAGRPHGRRRDSGLREPTTAKPRRNVWCIDRVVCGLAPMARRHGEGMPSTQGLPSCAQRAASQVPGEETFDPDDDILAIGCESREQRVWGGWQVTVHQHFPSLVQEAEGHGAGVPVDATGKLGLLGVQSPEVSSS